MDNLYLLDLIEGDATVDTLKIFVPLNSTACMVVVMITFALFGGQLCLMLTKLSSIKKEVDELNSYWSGFSRQSASTKFQEINKKLSDDSSLVKEAWLDFRDTLVYEKDPVNDSITVVRSTVDASIYFNDTMLLSKREVNIDFFNAVPGFLTGLGILGTFLGLTLGLGDIDPENAATLNKGVQGLLSGVGTAFITSLYGIAFALLFSFFQKIKMHAIKQAVAALQNNINKNFICRTPEYYLSLLPLTMEEQLTQLKKFNSEMAMNIASGIDEKLSQSIQPTLQALLAAIQELNNSGASTIAESLNTTVGSELHSFSDLLKEAGEKLKNNSENTQNLITEMNKQFMASTAKVTQMLENASQKQDTATAKMVEDIKTMAEAAKSSTVMMRQSFSDGSREISKEIAENLAEAFSSMHSQLAAVTDKFETMQNMASDKMSDTFAAISSELRNLAEELKEQNTAQNRNLGIFASEINSTFHGVATNFENIHSNGVQQMGDFLHTIEELKKSIAVMLEEAGRTADKFTAAASPISESTLNMADAVVELKSAQKDFISLAGNIVRDIDKNRTAYEQNLSTLSSLFGRINETIGLYNESLKGTSSELDRVFISLTQRVKDYDAVVKNSLSEYLNSFNNKVNEAITYLGGGVEELSGAIEGLQEALQTRETPRR